ncbi:carbohydrate-binding protein [beta proteobacterium AAP65]|nr:carbohydrate-binding protein [beta proteobacterium AAP65]
MPAALGRLLDPAAGPLLPPVRAEVFGAQRFALHGHSLGLTHAAERAGWRGSAFFPRLRDNIRMLRLAQGVLGAPLAGDEEPGPAAQWLLDNFALIDAQLLAIHEGLPRGYFRSLPVLQAEPLAGLPRVYGVAWAFVAHADSAFDEDLLVHYLGGYQGARALGLAELWALPTTLRVVLVENLRRLAERLATRQAARELARLCCEGPVPCSLATLQALCVPLAQRGVEDVFLEQLGQRLLDPLASGAASGPRPENAETAEPANASADPRAAPPALRLWLAGRLPAAGLLPTRQNAEQTADNLSVSNAVNALRALNDADWPEIVARSSPLTQWMLADPLFAAEHHRSRDQTLHGIEALARRSGRPELEVAQALRALIDEASGPLRAAQPGAAPSALPHTAAAGHWLRGPGQAALHRALGLRQPGALALQALARHAALPLYLAAVMAGTAALVLAVLGAALGIAPAATLHTWAWALLLAAPAAEAVIALLHRVVGESTQPRPLARLALPLGIPPAQRVLVVIPAMLSDRDAIDELVHRLHLHQLANPEPFAQFALLTDWADADTAGASADAALLAHASVGVAALNEGAARHGATASATPRFLLLHRERRYSRSESRWIGWERKRGKLEELVALLMQPAPEASFRGLAPASPFVDLGALSRPAAGTRYLVTLDSDTQLPPGRLRELVGVAAHPAQRPRLSANGRRVVGGYGILQPRLVTPLPQPHEDTFFHRLFAGHSGIDPYGAASAEVYQDLFEEASYNGKGLLDVAAMHAVLGGHLPEGQVLSHDLLEGALARCAAVTDITLVEDAPFHAEVAASRVHRWTRGDWQLLPILLRSLLQPARYPLGGLNRWKMADNLRRSLVAPAALAALLLSLAGLGPAPGAVLALVFAAFAAGPLMGALADALPTRDDVAWRHFLHGAAADVLRAFGGGLWQLAMLLPQALAALDAIALALWRLVFSHRLLLQWTTAAAAQAAASQSLPAALRRHAAVPLLAALLAATLLAVGTPWPAWTLLLCALWGAAPLWSWAASRRGLLPQQATCPDEDRAYLRSVARDTWRSFERTVSAADRHLPPDNLQTDPHEMLAHRTSPTNIGLYLLSVACAREFGWIDTPEMLQRLQATLDSVDTLPRHRGHLLNWYDTQTGQALPPMYVSTVDSGNLCGHLLAVAQACLAHARGLARLQAQGPVTMAAQTHITAQQLAQLHTLAARCQALAWAPDFHFLYHPRRHLLHIGWRVAEQQLDAGFYDLLASESRLTSLWAIAKGDVPVQHWAALGRPFYAVGTTAGLRSWSGSMFEYLMPTLVLSEPTGSVLHAAGCAALAEQRSYAAALGVPWGISESAHAGRDYTLAYQYAPQGVPRLALRRTPPDELVIAPYATALAAQLAPHAASVNYAVLQGLGARGPMGFIEALDYSPARQSGPQPCTAVHTVMAHHQGMSLVALANVLLGGVVQRWGGADPHLEAVASLLHERTPREVSRLVTPLAAPPPALQRQRAPTLARALLPGRLAIEPTQLLGHGRYAVALRANGAGRSSLLGRNLGRWRDDALRDAHGHFFWLRRAGEVPVTLSQHPAPCPQAAYRAHFHPDRVVLLAEWPTLRTQLTVWVSPEDDIEFRQVELQHTGTEVLEIELISAFEPTLAEARADEAHPAFSQMFLQARGHAAQRALFFERRPRLAGEAGLHLAHFLAESAPEVQGLQQQTQRAAWAGRNRSAARPLGLLQDLGAAEVDAEGFEALDTGLDPVCVLAVKLVLAPGAQVRLCFATAAAADAATLQSVVDKHRQASALERSSLMSATLAGIRLRTLRIGADSYAALQTLNTAMLLSLARPQRGAALRAAAPASAPPLHDRRELWRLGLSGDRPLLLVAAAGLQGLPLLRALNPALALWQWGGVACDLVVVNAEPASYEMPLQRELTALRDRHEADAAGHPGRLRCGWHLLRHDDLSATEHATLHALARLRLQADGRPLAAQVAEWTALHDAAHESRVAQRHTVLPGGWGAVLPDAAAARAVGHFGAAGSAADGRYTFEAGPQARPQRPWLNVLANEGFGSLMTEAGAGSSWALNSRLNQLTAWQNDAVADPPSEWLLLQDLDSGEAWSCTASAESAPGANCTVQHSAGSTAIAHRHAGLAVQARWCVDAGSAVRQLQLRVVNLGPTPRQLRVVAVCAWMLGQQRGDRASVHTHAELQGGPAAGAPSLTALYATQTEAAGGFGGGTAFLAWRPAAPTGGDDLPDWTCDRREFFNAAGQPVLPTPLGRRQGSGADPCAATGLTLQLAPGGAAERTLLLGWAPSPAAARTLLHEALASSPEARREAVRRHWARLLGAATVATPDPLFDALVNHWLLYQAVACRLWAKAGFYQAGGATGFRDQLQDSLALAWAAPEMLRAQIVRCAGRQFAEGDVQHWWHAPGGAGVRTHFSDDLLWLPYALALYLARVGDASVLDEQQPFLEGQTIAPGAEDAYGTPATSAETASVYEHAARAIDRSLRTGAHGLPLMGSGDWNDGMNRVGHGGQGESVWLAWFLCRVVADFAPLASARGEPQRAQRWLEAATGWRAALQGPAWDGAWYRRAFFDDGSPLGANSNSEARIDLIAQAWAVLSGVAPAARQQQALLSAQTQLVDAEHGLVRLLHPPLVAQQPSAGYIQAYPPGVRENGGQYTHAGVWWLMAQAAHAHTLPAPQAGFDAAWRTWCQLSPAHRSAEPTQAAAYGLEPYAVAADVYTAAPFIGRGGWSWYTGAAAWLHRAALETVFGLQFGPQTLQLRPALPSHWPQATLTLRREGRTLHFTLQRGTPPPGAVLLLPGAPLHWPALQGEHRFVVPLPA